MVEREFARLSIRDLNHNEVAQDLKYRDADELYVALGAGDLTAAVIATAVQRLRGTLPDKLLPKKRAKPRAHGDNTADISVRGVGDLMCNFARCCRPVPPEQIAGYITLGRGVSIHRQDCGNFLNLHQKHRERVIEVDWGGESNAVYPVDLRITAYDRQGLLKDLSGLIADEDMRVTTLTTRTDRASMQVNIDLTLEVDGLESLGRVMSRLEQVSNVVSVRRQT
jgi:GTP pyrophosphokinase